jgi:hypothetical protein
MHISLSLSLLTVGVEEVIAGHAGLAGHASRDDNNLRVRGTIRLGGRAGQAGGATQNKKSWVAWGSE